MQAALAAVTPEPLTSRAVAALREAITAGRLLPGTRLVEVQLAENLGVSRGTLRQALRELERDGFVISAPYRGTYVAELTPNSVHDTYALRGLLEGYAATQIPPEAMPGVLATQRDRLERMHRALAEGRSADVAAIDVEFHAPICVAAGNRRLLQIWESLNGPLQARYANQVDTLYTHDEIVARHQAIIVLLESGDAEAIEAGFRAHYLETARRMALEMETVRSDRSEVRRDEGGNR